jgi:hypothetical protein
MRQYSDQKIEIFEREIGIHAGHTAVGWAWPLILSEIAPDGHMPCLPATKHLAKAGMSVTFTGRMMWWKDVSWGLLLYLKI